MMNDDRSGASELKARIFEAFEHACRQGEVEVADNLLAIINDKWMKPACPPMLGMSGTVRLRIVRDPITGRYPAAGRVRAAGRTYTAFR